ncbi:MAG: DUF933 domain-containing protein [Microthrixaceae bacterium]|nr:DUF933 domain-containing protein [Microthrixaceae bacterium]
MRSLHRTRSPPWIRNVGVAKVPDGRVGRLAEMSGSAQQIHATVQFVDIAGLVKGAAQGEGLGNRFLSHIREVDALVFVLRAFRDDDVPGSHDPLEQLGDPRGGAQYADLESLEKQAVKRRKAAKGDKSILAEVEALDAAIDALAQGDTAVPRRPRPRADVGPGLLQPAHRQAGTALVNLDESQLDDPEPVLAPVRAAFGERGGSAVIGLCIQLEAEAAMLDEESRAEMLEALGLGTGALDTFLQAAYEMLGLRTFLTTGEKGVPGMDLQSGITCTAGGRGGIHTDFERGFIRAQVIQAEELLAAGSWAAARTRARSAPRGKDYEVADGDVVEFLFNV